MSQKEKIVAAILVIMSAVVIGMMALIILPGKRTSSERDPADPDSVIRPEIAVMETETPADESPDTGISADKDDAGAQTETETGETETEEVTASAEKAAQETEASPEEGTQNASASEGSGENTTPAESDSSAAGTDTVSVVTEIGAGSGSLTGDAVSVSLTEDTAAGSDLSEVPSRQESLPDTITVDNRTYTFNTRTESFLLLLTDDQDGSDPAGDSSLSADMILLLVVDYVSDKYTVLQIDRNTLAKISTSESAAGEAEYRTGLLYTSYSFGSGGIDSCRNTAESVSALLGNITIDGVLALDMEDIRTLSSRVGGITVTVLSDMTSEDPTFRKNAQVTLIGDKAVKYLRALRDPDGPAGEQRVRMQQDFLTAALNKVKSFSASFQMDLLDQAGKAAVTDLTGKRLSGIADTCRGYQNGGIVTLPGSFRGEAGTMEYIPDLEQIILALFYIEI